MSCLRKAVLITYPFEEAIKEATSLADTVGYSVERIVKQRHITQSRYGIGRGKAEEVKELVKQLEPEVIIFDEVLKPTQQYNLASLCQVEIIDRERLILEIFERRASTAESRIQIKLAQLRYDMVRAREKVRLAKIGEQPGFFGMGKYDADIYYLDINKRAAVLKKKLEREEKRRDLHRVQRSKAGLSIISIAGYTSAGKTTLFNTLTGESKNAGQGLFTTLSTFTRAMKFNTRKVLVSDTVGFISKLPPYMIDAFKSTLHELTHSNLILLVLDISQSIEEIGRKLDSCIHIMNELGVPMTKVLYVLNKVDLISIDDAFDKSEYLGIPDSKKHILPVSAKTGFNITQLKNLISLLVFPDEEQTAEEPVSLEETNESRSS
ncbi:MAG: GTPase HflX [Nitrososphaeraceae archaeon]|jgi:GTPase|nr:GTPase HflX [Nitrososphaeraceae archaeon]